MMNKYEFNYDGKFNKIYYETTSKENAGFNKDFKFKKITEFLKKEDKLCEFGCGDASKLILFNEYVSELWGFDISNKAISKGKKKYKKLKLFVSDSGEIFRDNKFDVTISLYTLEHVVDPETFIDEMLRVTKKGGLVIGVCPNFGSPFFPSPPSIYNKGFFKRVFLVVKRVGEHKQKYKTRIFSPVKPIIDKDWQPDYDTISEVSLDKIVKKYRKKIIYANSFWSIKPYFYFVFFLVSFLKPVKYWGANCFFVIRK